MKKENRILKYEEFSEIIGSSRRIRTPHFLINSRKRESGEARIGISVSKRNGHAVTRNKIKRQIRYMIGQGFDLSRPVDIVIVARAAYDTADFEKEKIELIDALKNIGE